MSIIFKGKNSELDFDIYPAKKSLTPPKKKRITETVPFMNGEWDFSKIGGEQYYETRYCKYEFDIIGETKAEMNELAKCVANWLTVDCEGESLQDTDIPDFHFVVINADASFSEDDCQGLLTVEFTCEPFLIGNEKKSVNFKALAAATTDCTVTNKGSKPALLNITCGRDLTMTVNGESHEMKGGNHAAYMMLPVGETTFTIQAISSNCTFTLEWDEVSI